MLKALLYAQWAAAGITLIPALLVPLQIMLFCVGAAQAMAVTLSPACAALTPWWQGQSFNLLVMGLVSVHAGGWPLAAFECLPVSKPAGHAQPPSWPNLTIVTVMQLWQRHAQQP